MKIGSKPYPSDQKKQRPIFKNIVLPDISPFSFLPINVYRILMNLQGKFHLDSVIPSVVEVSNGTKPSGENEPLETISFITIDIPGRWRNIRRFLFPFIRIPYFRLCFVPVFSIPQPRRPFKTFDLI